MIATTKKALNLSEAYKLIFWYVLIACAAGIPFQILKRVFHFEDSSATDLMGYLLIHLSLLYFLWKNYGAISFQHEKCVSWTYYGFILLATLSLIMLLDPLESFVHLPDFMKTLSKTHKHVVWIDCIQVAVAAPIMEEVILRKILLDKLLRQTSPLKAIVHVSIIWGIMHFNPVQSVEAFLIGLFIGYVYISSKSVLPGLLVHFIINLCFCILTNYHGGKFETIYALFHSNVSYAICYVSSILIFGTVIAVIIRGNASHPKTMI